MGARCSSLDGHLPTKEHSGSGVFWAEEPFSATLEQLQVLKG